MSLQEIRNQYESKQIEKPVYIDQMYLEHQKLFEYSQYLKSTDIAKIEIMDEEVVMTFRSTPAKLICKDKDKRIAPIETLNFKFYERDEFAMAKNLVSPNAVVFDIGANIGWFSIYITAHLGNLVKCHAFEPIPETYILLNKNISINAFSNISAYNYGFSENSETLNFYFYPEGSGNSSMKNMSQGSSVKQVTCKVIKLDEFTQKNQLRIDFIKCDVEGAELLVFKGGLKTISENHPIIFTELLRKWSAKFNYHPNDVIHLLGKSGYQCFTVVGESLRSLSKVDESTVETNYFFLHVEKHAEKIKKYLIES